MKRPKVKKASEIEDKLRTVYHVEVFDESLKSWQTAGGYDLLRHARRRAAALVPKYPIVRVFRLVDFTYHGLTTTYDPGE